VADEDRPLAILITVSPQFAYPGSFAVLSGNAALAAGDVSRINATTTTERLFVPCGRRFAVFRAPSVVASRCWLSCHDTAASVRRRICTTLLLQMLVIGKHLQTFVLCNSLPIPADDDSQLIR